MKYKPTKFCWWCGKKLWVGKHVIKIMDYEPRTLHIACAKEITKIGYETKDYQEESK